jgi:large subunit ribosomal protein L17e
VFTKAGLLEVGLKYLFWFSSLIPRLQALTGMLEETTTGSNLSRKANLLMAEVLQIANQVLPLSMASRIQVNKYVLL